MTIKQRLDKFILTDGFHIVVDLEKSQLSWIIDQETGNRYLDCYSQFASQPIGWNHPYLNPYKESIQKASMYKIANSDMYSEIYATFVEELSSITPDFNNYFFIDGGALAVENSLKAAFDWKCQVTPKHQKSDGQNLDVIHLEESFHGRSGYTMSLLGTGELKTKWFPKFKWTRLVNPKIYPDITATIQNEEWCLYKMEKALKKDNTAAVIFETIQGEGGDNQFRKSFFQEVRRLTNKYNALFILDEVQAGFGATGKWWAYEHYDVKPDILVFGKKTQVCGFCSNERIQEAKNNVFKQSGRINSTWGSNFTDMSRSTAYMKIIKDNNVLDNVNQVGDLFLNELKQFEDHEFGPGGNLISNVRGKGLMIAFDLPNAHIRDKMFDKLSENVLILKSGTRSIRLRPHLTFNEKDVNYAIEFIKESIDNLN